MARGGVAWYVPASHLESRETDRLNNNDAPSAEKKLPTHVSSSNDPIQVPTTHDSHNPCIPEFPVEEKSSEPKGHGGDFGAPQGTAAG
jgi:hypothetical protein